MPLLRDIFIHLSENQFLNNSTKKMGLKFGANKVVGGVSIDDTIERIKDINDQEMSVVFDNLGEFITDKEDAIQEKGKIIAMINAIHEFGVDSHASVKLSQIGLQIDYDFCLNNIDEIIAVANKLDIFVNIDMESYNLYPDTLRILDAMLEKYDNVGTVIQAYLLNSPDDILKYKDTRLRIVKGAYKESADAAHQDKADIDKAYLELIKSHLTEGTGYTSIATHDHHIIEEIIDFIEQNDIDHDRFEFQMLYGFRKDYQKNLVKRGYKMVVYLPFGMDWYAYFMRRLAERPQNINLIVKSVTKHPAFKPAAFGTAGILSLFTIVKLFKRK
ncbi:proline dehydrogenase family protein [Corticicoccus populi]|uniref:proline dehydrogenase n=1 Tax=Corticicoccus populi TaxID=1812821 RepID=A0ABW5WU23_9STAP